MAYMYVMIYSLFFTVRLQLGMYCTLNSTSQLGLLQAQGHMWLAATTLDHVALGHT